MSLWVILHIYAIGRMFRWWGVKRFIWGVLAGIGIGVSIILLKIAYVRDVIAADGFINRLADFWMGYLLLLICSLVVFEIVGLIWRKIKARYKFYCTLVLSVLLSVFSFFNARYVRVEKLQLPANMDYRIIQMNDLHLGYMGISQLKNIIAKTNALKPDIVIIAGDLIDKLEESDLEKLAYIDQIQAPIYFAMGNHEGYEGFSHVEKALDRHDVNVLRESWAEPVKGLRIFGVDDSLMGFVFLEGMNKDSKDSKLLGSSDSYDILISHKPELVEHAAEKGFDLMLSGHTHAGQIIPFGLIVKMVYPYFDGTYQVGDMTLNVSSGAGFWGPPMRFYKSGEIVCIDLQNAVQQ